MRILLSAAVTLALAFPVFLSAQTRGHGETNGTDKASERADTGVSGHEAKDAFAALVEDFWANAYLEIGKPKVSWYCAEHGKRWYFVGSRSPGVPGQAAVDMRAHEMAFHGGATTTIASNGLNSSQLARLPSRSP